MRTCIVCKKSVRDGDEIEHLRSNHLGPHYFWLDGRKYRTEEPSMTVAKILKMTNGNAAYHFYEERDGKEIFYSQSEAVDLTRTPHFFLVPPATERRLGP